MDCSSDERNRKGFICMHMDSPSIATIINDGTVDDMGHSKAMSSIDISNLNTYCHCEAAKKNHGIKLHAQILSVMPITIHSISLFKIYE